MVGQSNYTFPTAAPAESNRVSSPLTKLPLEVLFPVAYRCACESLLEVLHPDLRAVGAWQNGKNE